MATPLSPDRLVAALRAEGVLVVEHAGWRTHNRNGAGTWGPVNGVLIHHTAGSNSLGVVWTGRADLPGPLAHTHLDKDGTATMLSAGRANHAGKAARNAFDAVVNESATHPRPSASSGTVDGNAHLYGIEIENLGTGRDPYPEAQYQAAVRWAAAICRAHGWTANSVVGHKETSIEGKVDPSFDMGGFRADVAERLKHPASWSPGGTPPTSTHPKENTAMRMTDQVPLPEWVQNQWPEDQGLSDGEMGLGNLLGSAYGHARVSRENSEITVAALNRLAAAVDRLTAAITKS